MGTSQERAGSRPLRDHDAQLAQAATAAGAKSLGAPPLEFVALPGLIEIRRGDRVFSVSPADARNVAIIGCGILRENKGVTFERFDQALEALRKTTRLASIAVTYAYTIEELQELLDSLVELADDAEARS